ncbi:MAG: acyl-CoA/acyl-ACP dehydrogenase [Deltaproteobacteria bacterium]|nr:acyl-CoA/acyl-ACP dehydrogenase [Deltaproteobacteria bacterium]
MDFELSDDQKAVRDLARGILEKEVTVERLKQLERDGAWRDPALVATLADAGLLGLVVPAAHGGMGLGLPEACLLLQELGRVAAPGAFLSTLVGALALARDGTEAQQREWLPPIAAGDAEFGVALVDAGTSDPAAPAANAERNGSAWILTGEKRWVAGADRARRLLVPARAGGETRVFLVDPQAAGVRLAPHRLSTGEPVFTVTLAGAAVPDADALAAADAAARLHASTLAAICATQLGVSERALDLTARYARERIQFGVPIGSFQAVQHRLADCYIDLEAMRWTTWRAVEHVAEGRPAARACAVAKFWAADGGARIAAACQHLHGGIGVDLDYPIHRYFLHSKSLELALGGATPQLVRLGRDLAASGPAELP